MINVNGVHNKPSPTKEKVPSEEFEPGRIEQVKLVELLYSACARTCPGRAASMALQQTVGKVSEPNPDASLCDRPVDGPYGTYRVEAPVFDSFCQAILLWCETGRFRTGMDRGRSTTGPIESDSP